MKTGNKALRVFCKDRQVGTLAESVSGKIAFQYDDTWLRDGFSISPFSLPLRGDVFVPSNYHFNGLFGVFADSLPDAWGQLLLDRFFRAKGIAPDQLSVLDRLSVVGSNGMGALEYRPEAGISPQLAGLSPDELAEECDKVFAAADDVNIDELFLRGGSSGGARPKVYISAEGEEWLVKFPYSRDAADSGIMEYDYMSCAAACGIEVPEIRLFPSVRCTGYFASKRFDRPKRHMISAAALLEIDFERSLADYADLLKLTKILTGENRNDIENMYRRMCFNVFAVNQDDHLKNFSYLYDEARGIWRLAPAYDLTHLVSGYGEHTATVGGKGRDIGLDDLIKVGTGAGLRPGKCRKLAEEVSEKVREMLRHYL